MDNKELSCFIEVNSEYFMDKIIQLFINGIKNITQDYYNLRTTYEPCGIVRERVFCYELYHRIRKLLETDEELNKLLTLNGEIDKREHREFDPGDQKNPDFVFHIPGKMEGNTTIIEVKGSMETDGYLEGIIKDLETISTFINKYHYLFGIITIYQKSKTN
jgi:hypothetical protein